ncbi:MAG TPA: hypothetical protein VFE54_14810 [Mucilaginibacter sp.]|jgi:hypothetical protein|nr:hypothetical protein [Mucilaginibacter sp.]
MTLGYQITGYDNNSFMTGSCDKLKPELIDIPKCDVCGYRTDYRYTNRDFILRRKTLDFSSTYDGVTIVSLKFKEFCIRYEYNNLVFAPLPKAPNFFQFYILGNVIEYDARLKENLCSACGQYESIVGPTIKLENINEPLADGFYQSDLWFASGNEKSPVMIIAPKTLENLKVEKFKNLCLDVIKR